VQIDWAIDDPRGVIAAAEAKLDMNLDPPTRQIPTLVDLGASGLVYLALGPSQQTELLGTSAAWQVVRGTSDRWEPFVVGPRPPDRYAPPEGWAHAMDRRRCLAMAIEHFAAASEDCLGLTADGHVELRRRFLHAETSAAKRMRFWLHFVPYPPQATAATSPQAMQNPLVTQIHFTARQKDAR
jgi:hypothetical protein